ncbi:hypothetical protein ACEPAH_7897 [Sanghuangporus vaninii]
MNSTEGSWRVKVYILSGDNSTLLTGYLLFGCEDGLNRHLSHSVVPSKENEVSQNGDRKGQKYDADIVHCIESDEALRYEVGRDPERFNFYYLGVIEDYEMDDEHFEALAKRKRKDEWFVGQTMQL